MAVQPCMEWIPIKKKKIRTPVGNTDNIQVKRVVKQGTIFGPIMCCTETSTVNSTGEEVKYRYGKIKYQNASIYGWHSNSR